MTAACHLPALVAILLLLGVAAEIAVRAAVAEDRGGGIRATLRYGALYGLALFAAGVLGLLLAANGA